MKRLSLLFAGAVVAAFCVSAEAKECSPVTEVEVMARCMQDATSHPIAWCKKPDNLAAAKQKLIDEKIGMLDRALAAWNKDITDSAPTGDAEAVAAYYQRALRDGLAGFKENVAKCREELAKEAD